MVIRVHQIGFSDEHQCLFVDSEDPQVKDQARLDSSPRAKQWRPPPVYIEFPSRPAPDLWNLYESYSFALSPAVEPLLHHQLLEVELLPFSVGPTQLLLANVTEVRNYLDVDRTRWVAGCEGYLFEAPEFHVQRFGGPSLFRLPSDDVWLYCWEADDDLDHSFRHAVERSELSGLVFEEIWNSVDGGRRPSSVP